MITMAMMTMMLMMMVMVMVMMMRNMMGKMIAAVRCTVRCSLQSANVRRSPPHSSRLLRSAPKVAAASRDPLRSPLKSA